MSGGQVDLMRAALAGCSRDLIQAAERVGREEVGPDAEASIVVDALVEGMLSDCSREEGLSERGDAIDDVIGIVQQLSASFYESR